MCRPALAVLVRDPCGDRILLQTAFRLAYTATVTIETFKKEITEAAKAYDKFVVCVEKPPDDFATALGSLMQKAIKAYDNRGPNLRHGIALDRQITIILSQSDSDRSGRPLCGIYFNLHSPYRKNALPQTAQPLKDIIGESPQTSAD